MFILSPTYKKNWSYHLHSSLQSQSNKILTIHFQKQILKQIFQETSFSSSRLGCTVKVSVINNDMNMMFSFCYLVLLVKYLISNINCQYCDSIPNYMESNYNSNGNIQSSDAMKHHCQFNIFGRFSCHQYSACRVLDGMWSWTPLLTADWRSSTRRWLSCSYPEGDHTVSTFERPRIVLTGSPKRCIDVHLVEMPDWSFVLL